jgi:hypothetical protein
VKVGGGVVLVVVLAFGLVWWESIGPGSACGGAQHSVTSEYGPGVRTHPSIDAALRAFGRYPGIRGRLTPTSLIRTDARIVVAGATVNEDRHPDTRGGVSLDIWKNGEVVQSVTIDRYQGGWVVAGYSGCSPIP